MAPNRTWRELYRGAVEQLGNSVDARRIVERAAGRTGAEWLVALDEPAPDRCVPFIDGMLTRRLAGEPLQYVVGAWGFRRLDLLLDRRVLIPRPETEQVVDQALRELAGRIEPNVVDLGTGSGAIALAIAAESSDARVWAVDASEGACAVARANLAGMGGMPATRVRVVQGEWFEPLPATLRGEVDLIVSNPPYIAEHEVPSLPAEVVQWEPRMALIAGPRGTEAIEAILSRAPSWLRRPGVAVIEIAPHQADAVKRFALDAGFGEAEVIRDLTNRDRVLVARVA